MYIILASVSALLAVVFVPELMHTGRSFYEYNDPTYTPKDMERYLYDIQRRMEKMAKGYPVSEINTHEFEDINRRIYVLRQALKEVEMQEEMRQLEQRLQALEDAYKATEWPGF